MAPVEGTHLGKEVKYPKTYSPELLVAVPRHLNREVYAIEEAALPFSGKDVWHAYEVSFLTQNGLPIAGVLKLVYPCDNPFLVESKSLKLYLNSFNMERLGNTKAEAVEVFLDKVKSDLDKCLQTSVDLLFVEEEASGKSDFNDFEVLEDNLDFENVVFSDIKENPALLNKQEGSGIMKVASHLLRSNCKITYQPDWGSVFIHMQGDTLPDKVSLLKYIVSFRDENHFHEEVCEMMYKRLQDAFSPEKLMVTCMYTRRGGIDICPVRVSDETLLPQFLVDSTQLSQRTLRQ